jgi:cytochrome P450
MLQAASLPGPVPQPALQNPASDAHLAPMQRLAQSPTDPGFVQDPYPFYERARAAGPLFFWEDYGLVCAPGAETVAALLKDRRFGRTPPQGHAPPRPPHTAAFYAVEDHSMLELEPPRHTRLRARVTRAFTTRRISRLEDGLRALCAERLDAISGPFELIDTLARPLPVIAICRLLGVPEAMAGQLLAWSNAMVAMYQARRSAALERAADTAAAEFSAFLRDHVARRRKRPADDLISELLAPGEAGEALSEEELVSTCILILNAGHEATVHTVGNGARALIRHGARAQWFSDDAIGPTVEEVLRWDPPLHLFTRWAYDQVDIAGHLFRRGDRVGLMLAAANRDPEAWPDPARFDPGRPVQAHASFGSGIHFCVGAPLARMELRLAFQALFGRFPGLRVVEEPVYADLYHFHGLERLMLAP